MTPYIITTKRPLSEAEMDAPASLDVASINEAMRREIGSHWAVTTPEKARAHARDECIAAEAADIAAAEAADEVEYRWDHRYAPFEAQCESLPESGGTVGPLPNGTVIEVKRVWWSDLATLAGVETTLLHDQHRARVIDAYNARST